jgi:hypothetical protein
MFFIEAIIKFCEIIAWVFQKILIPMSRLVFYLVIICLAIALITNLAGILGVVIFFIIFYYYVVGIIFVPPSNPLTITAIVPGQVPVPGSPTS